MRRSATALVLVAVAATTLSGCGGDSAYCSAVKDHESTLKTFGTKRTDQAFGSYARVLRAVAKEAPAEPRKNWLAIAKVTDAVLASHRDVGIALEDMTDADLRARLTAADIESLNKAYDAFNNTRKQRDAVIADVKDQCDIVLT